MEEKDEDKKSLPAFRSRLLSSSEEVDCGRADRKYATAEHFRDSSSRRSSFSSLSTPPVVRPSADNFSQNSLVWNLFQDAAANTSRLYQSRSQSQSSRDNHWTNFQNAASSISMLYKESLDAQQRSFEAGFQSGVEKAYNELMDWLVQDPRYHRNKSIRVDDVVHFVYSPKNPATFHAKMRSSPSSGSKTSFAATLNNKIDHPVSELEAFRDALHVSSLNGAMSHFSVNRSPPRCSPSRTRSVDLHAFVTEEIRRHKRTNEDAFDLEQEDDEDSSHGSNPFKRSRFSPFK